MTILRGLSESELSFQVITPLLKAMFPGDRIEFTHGPNEKGRDFICYASHPALNQRITYCIQVKNHKINAQIGSTYSISTLRQQVQAAKETGVVGSSGEILKPDEVWIINTYDCADSFRRSNASDFDAIKTIGGRFVDGNELETLLNRFCPYVVAEILQWKDARSVEMISNLSIHRESRAFGLRFDRMISDFYIQAKISVGSRLMGLFEADKLRIENLTVTLKDVIEFEDLGKFQESRGSGFSADDVSRSDIISTWNNLEQAWPLQIKWSTRELADPNRRGGSIFEKTFEIRTVKAQAELRRRLAKARKQFPSTLKGNEGKLRSALDTFLSAEQLLRACEAGKAVIRLSKDLMGSENPSLRVDSDLSILELGRIVLTEGGPGSGKTTLLRRVAIAVLKAGRSLKYLDCAKVEANHILAAVAEVQRRSGQTEDAAQRATIWDAVLGEIDRRASATDDSPLRDGGFVGIIDGLDELPAGLLMPFVETFLSSANCFDRLIVSSRDSYESDLKGRVPVLTVSRFEDPDREEFFRRWFRHEPRKQEIVFDLFSRNRDVAENARVPLIATLIAALIENDQEPGSRLQIYRQRLRLLLDFWDRSREVERAKISPENKERFVQELAYRMHARHQREITNADAERVFMSALGYAGYKINFESMISELVRIAGVLLSGDDRTLTFGHLSFQEHLVGERLARTAHSRDLRPLLGDSWWAEPIAFYAAAKRDITELLEHCSKVGCLEVHSSQLLALIRHAPFTDPGAVEILKELVVSANRMVEPEED